MNVWSVSRCFPYEGCSLEGVFSSREKAEAFIGRWVGGDRSDLSVTGHELDNPEWVDDDQTGGVVTQEPNLNEPSDGDLALMMSTAIRRVQDGVGWAGYTITVNGERFIIGAERGALTATHSTAWQEAR